MLNISNNSVPTSIDLSQFESSKQVVSKHFYRNFNRISIFFLIAVLIILFLPWTQNVKGKGNVTILRPNQSPQTIQSPISGRIEEWFVREGNYVKKGDTIMRISEIKTEYFDDRLIERTGNQIQSKTSSIGAYKGKAGALQNQINALKNERALKLEQARNKIQQAKFQIQSDSIDLEAAKTNLAIAETQFNRAVTLQEEGLKATKDVEEKRLKQQETQAKLISQENKLLKSKNELINAKIELSSINASYADKIAKSQSDLFTAQSSQFDTEAEVAKLENNYSNYEKRFSLRYVTAPQDGYINRTLKGGIGETFKSGEKLVTIMPEDYELAVETYIRPIDLPLMHIDERVRVQFDGWPAIVFTGWENISYGTYGAKVVAIENFISDNGLYRILLAPDEDDHEWPEGIRVGSGAKTIALLDDVPVWFEIWRRINGFPPNFYKPDSKQQTATKK